MDLGSNHHTAQLVACFELADRDYSPPSAVGGRIEVLYSDPMYRRSAVLEMGERVEAYQASTKQLAVQAEYEAFLEHTQAHVQSLELVSDPYWEGGSALNDHEQVL